MAQTAGSTQVVAGGDRRAGWPVHPIWRRSGSRCRPATSRGRAGRGNGCWIPASAECSHATFAAVMLPARRACTPRGTASERTTP